MKINLSSYTWEEVQDLAESDPVVLLPLGAFEQHGKHLPLKVDEFMVSNIANEAVNAFPSAITVPVLKKLNDAVAVAITLAVRTEPVIIEGLPPITLATINELAFIDVFLNSKVQPVSAATLDCKWDLISPLEPLIA